MKKAYLGWIGVCVAIFFMGGHLGHVRPNLMDQNLLDFMCFGNFGKNTYVGTPSPTEGRPHTVGAAYRESLIRPCWLDYVCDISLKDKCGWGVYWFWIVIFILLSTNVWADNRLLIDATNCVNSKACVLIVKLLLHCIYSDECSA